MASFALQPENRPWAADGESNLMGPSSMAAAHPLISSLPKLFSAVCRIVSSPVLGSGQAVPPTALRSGRVLNVVSATPPRPASRAPRTQSCAAYFCPAPKKGLKHEPALGKEVYFYATESSRFARLRIQVGRGSDPHILSTDYPVGISRSTEPVIPQDP